MHDKNLTMQSDDIGESVICSQPDKMTFSKSIAFASTENQNEQIDDPDFCNKSVKLEDINFDDEIEKVEVTSEDSSSVSTGKKSDDVIPPLPIPVFSGIPQENPNESVKNWLQKITEIHNGITKNSLLNTQVPSTTPSRVVKYQDLPYMGEITLDNSKPRRGRKPKKADICHLIYKNYGTIFPGTPNANSYLEKETSTRKVASGAKDSDGAHKNQVQNKIISSLLEKRLTQDHKKPTARSKADQNEPLNLCIRDLNQLKIRLMKKKDNIYVSEIKSEPHSDDDIELVPGASSPAVSIKSDSRFPPATPDSLSSSSTEVTNSPDPLTGPGGCLYWPNTGFFINPMALQQHLMMYQRFANNINYTLPSHSPRPPPEDGKSDNTELRKIAPKVSKSNETDIVHHDVKSKRNANCSSSERTPAKRKRSAIFIPPIPPENSNPATEVSICKFKFTGGAKPSLQEKKMLSVDSGGNFRYYSGTGDKSMRGYEFFPRETLQQQITNSQGSSTGAFLQASGEKIYPVPPVEITGGSSSSDFLLTSDLPSSSLGTIHQEANCAKTKKRKSRKSLQREKLEKTFKEKGFLIQTQQLESAEGATYCKFRQLRKFTRYLFRSWKDYLPGNVRELQEGEREAPNNEACVDGIPDNVSIKSDEVPSASGGPS